MTVIREFLAVLGMETKGADFKQAENALQKIAGLATVVVGAVVAVGAAFGVATKGVVDNARLLDKWNRITGESVENLDAMRLAAEGLGLDTKKTFEGMSELADRASDVILNIGELTNEAGEGFKGLGFTSVQQLKKTDGSLRDIPELFEDVLDRLSKMENAGERAGTAMRLFGDDTGLAIAGLPLERFQALKQEALELGLVMGTKDVEAARDFEQMTGRLGSRLNAIRNTVIQPLLPMLTDYAGRLTSAATANAEFARRTITPVFRAVADAALFVIGTLQTYASIIDDVVTATIGWRGVSRVLAVALGIFLARQVGRLAFAMRAGLLRALLALQAQTLRFIVQTIAARIQVALFGAKLLLVAALLDSVFKTFKGGDTIFTRFAAKFDPAKGKPEDNFFVKTLRLIVGLLKEAGRLAGQLGLIATEEGPIREEAVREFGRKRVFGRLEEMARQAQGRKPGEPKQRAGEGLLRLLGVSPTSTGAPSLPSIAPIAPGGAAPPVIRMGDTIITVRGGGGNPKELAGEIGKVVEETQRKDRRALAREFKVGN